MSAPPPAPPGPRWARRGEGRRTVAGRLLGSYVLVILAFAVATGVGVFFGYYPARKAARLKPIDALRYQ